MRHRVACVQPTPSKGRVSDNLDRIGEAITQASASGAKLLLFPEACVTGYFLEGGVLEHAMSAEELRAALQARTASLTEDVDVAMGFYESAPGGRLYNSCGYFELGPNRAATREVYRKIFLPTYGLFDEARFVGRGKGLSVIETRFGRVATLICEDAWHSILPTLCAVRGADILLVPSASPARGFTPEGVISQDRYRRLIRGIAEEHGLWCLNAQLSGFEGGKGLMGGSIIVDPFGTVVSEAPLGGEAIVYADLDLKDAQVARAQSPLLRDLEGSWAAMRELVAETA